MFLTYLVKVKRVNESSPKRMFRWFCFFDVTDLWEFYNSTCLNKDIIYCVVLLVDNIAIDGIDIMGKTDF